MKEYEEQNVNTLVNMNSSLIELILLSQKRTKIFLFLKEDPKTITEIREFLHLSSVAVLPQLKILRENSLVMKKRDVYSLTPLGLAIAGRLQPMIDLTKVFGIQYDYWASHAIECIPAPFLKRIGDLSDRTFSKQPGNTHLYEIHKEFVENFMKAKKLSGIVSIFHPSHISLFFNFVKMGKDISIIMTPQIHERMKEDFGALLDESLKFENANLFVCREKIEFNFSVTDILFFLTLPFSDGTYDLQSRVMGFDPVSLQWGEDLFSYYREISDKV
jgi:predicted transcriptional regulator